MYGGKSRAANITSATGTVPKPWHFAAVPGKEAISRG